MYHFIQTADNSRLADFCCHGLFPTRSPWHKLLLIIWQEQKAGEISEAPIVALMEDILVEIMRVEVVLLIGGH